MVEPEAVHFSSYPILKAPTIYNGVTKVSDDIPVFDFMRFEKETLSRALNLAPGLHNAVSDYTSTIAIRKRPSSDKLSLTSVEVICFISWELLWFFRLEGSPQISFTFSSDVIEHCFRRFTFPHSWLRHLWYHSAISGSLLLNF